MSLSAFSSQTPCRFFLHGVRWGRWVAPGPGRRPAAADGAESAARSGAYRTVRCLNLSVTVTLTFTMPPHRGWPRLRTLRPSRCHPFAPGMTAHFQPVSTLRPAGLRLSSCWRPWVRIGELSAHSARGTDELPVSSTARRSHCRLAQARPGAVPGRTRRFDRSIPRQAWPTLRLKDSADERAPSTRWRDCRSSRHQRRSLRFGPSPRAESIAVIF
jgi:hypothetical protein